MKDALDQYEDHRKQHKPLVDLRAMRIQKTSGDAEQEHEYGEADIENRLLAPLGCSLAKVSAGG